jgi:hypothetical protein
MLKGKTFRTLPKLACMKAYHVCGLAHRRPYLLSPLLLQTKAITGSKGATESLSEESTIMMWTILVVLLLLWLFGFYGGFVTTSLIHLLLLAAAVVLAINIFGRRHPV